MRLLAKSPKGYSTPVTLEAHLEDTEKACLRVFRGRILVNWGRAFGLEDLERWILNEQIACLAHDLGKANVYFQDMMDPKYKGSDKPPVKQPIRHEHISALILAEPEVQAWLRTNPDLDVESIISAVGGHHFKTSRDWCLNFVSDGFQAYLADPQVTTILKRMAEVARLPEPPVLQTSGWDERWDSRREAYMDLIEWSRHAIVRDPKRKAFHAALKAGLIVSDSVSSAMARLHSNESDLFAWVDQALHLDALSPEAISEIVDNRRRSSGIVKLRTFQEEVPKLGPRGALVSGCGSGKTLAAFLWAEEMLREYEVGRIVYLYPTRGTATEGFRDYMGWIEGGTLQTSSSDYELEAMKSNPPESIEGKDELSETDHRLYALKNWGRKGFSATVDQFLAFMGNRYGSICMLPILLDSVVIMDEVHSYDRRMWDTLKCWLAAFDVPCLLMTASLNDTRRTALESLGVKIYPTAEDVEHLQDLNQRETYPRYDIQETTQAEAQGIADEAVLRGKKVLWVVNTVARSQELAQLIPEAINYHSRFRLMDKHGRQQEVMRAFRRNAPCIAITTQVCEMSLDIDADVLITELCPPESLIQRCGRCARGTDRTAPVYVYQPKTVRPYTRLDIDRGKVFLANVKGSGVSIRELGEALAELGIEEIPGANWTAFYDLAHTAEKHPFRDINPYTKTSVLDSDLPTIESKLRDKLPIEGYQLEVPEAVPNITDYEISERLPRYINVISGKPYDPRFGYLSAERDDLQDRIDLRAGGDGRPRPNDSTPATLVGD